MCDWDVNLRCRHCHGSRLVRQREPIHLEREISPLLERRSARSLCRSCQGLREELQRLNDRLAAIIERNQRLEQARERERSSYSLLERQLEETREELQRLTQERDRLQRQVETLCDVNWDLRERHDLTPGPAPYTPRRTTATRGVGRRTYAAGVQELHEHVITVGRITLEEVDFDGKFVKVKNASDRDRSLHGWTIAIQYDNESPSIYKFPEHFRIHAGQTITIWAGSTSASQRSPDDLVWRGQSSWGTDEDIRMTLLSHVGEEMARRTLVRGVLGSRSQRGNEDDFP